MLLRAKCFGTFIILAAAAAVSPAQTWRQVGPPGGTVISLGADPHNAQRLYLGTSDGHVFTSDDEGGHWRLLSRIGAGQDDVITHIVVDSRDSNRLFASTWTLYSGGGGVYRSDDAGRSWHLIGLAKETVRALAQSPSNPRIFAAGSLTGIYRSTDEGKTWERISPEHHEDLRNFDSVAFDPHDANIIYAGTYHLPWKTADGGKHWTSIKAGMIDDSDVMSIIVDPANPSNVHATACSGIYRSIDSGSTWKRYGGIPFVYRRTQLIRQDPQHPETLYAGTTSGLWKTTNEGAEWKRLTPLDWVVNAVVIDPKNPERVIIGTQREGVQISENGGATFAAFNNGFNHQHILDVAMDREHPERTLVVLTFDENAFLATKNRGATWTTLGPGLKRTELRHVYAAPTGWWASLNKGGFMRYEDAQHKWLKAGLLEGAAMAPARTSPRARKASARQPAPSATGKLMPYQVNDLAFAGANWFAATSGGLLVSHDKGATWRVAGSEPLLKQASQSLEASADGAQIWAVSGHNLLYSSNGGAHWEARDIPFAAAGNLRIYHVNDANLFITSNMGLYLSRDSGRTWNREQVQDLQFQAVAGSGKALLVSLQRRGLLASFDEGKSWKRINDPLADEFFPMLQAQSSGAVVAASSTEGIFTLEPGARSADSIGTSMLMPSSDVQKPR